MNGDYRPNLDKVLKKGLVVPDFSGFFQATQPLRDFSKQFREVAVSWQKALEPLKEPLRRWAEASEQCQAFEKEGWLPHWSTPFHLIEGDAASFDDRVTAFYQSEWRKICEQLRKSVRNSTDDPETIAVFNEATEAHGHGLYRASTRLIFPEIERVAREFFHDGDPAKRTTSQHDLIKAITNLHPADMKTHGVAGFRLFMALAQHTYQPAISKEEIKKFSESDVPNRHALLHGVVSYKSEKASLNSLFLFDYVIDVIQILASEESPE